MSLSSPAPNGPDWRSQADMGAAGAPIRAAIDIQGDAASSEALSRFGRNLARASRRPSPKAQKKSLERLRAALEAMQRHDYEKASERARQALEHDAENGVAWHLLAIALEKAGQFPLAIEAYEAALKWLPNELDICLDLGRLAQRMDGFNIAERLYRLYLAHNPWHVEVTNNLVCLLRDNNRYDEAEHLLQDVLQVTPDSPVLWNTLGSIRSDRGEMQDAITYFDQALSLDPDFHKSLYNRSTARAALGDLEGALSDIDAALALIDDPFEQASVDMSKGLILMRLGRLDEAFRAYEARLSPHLDTGVTFLVRGERWKAADDLAGRCLWVIGEQGLGDEILFANVLPDVMEAIGPDGQLVISVDARLVPLFQTSYPTAQVKPHHTLRHQGRLVRAVIGAEQAPAADMWAPIGSLWQVFRRSVDAFPTRPAFLAADPDRVAHWRNVLAEIGTGPKVGLVWKSLKLDGFRHRYFSPFEALEPILRTPGVVFVNLQYGDTDEEMAWARAQGLSVWTPPEINLKDDLYELAALCQALDLVLGPPNATSNIAAACGVPWWAITAPDAWPRFGTDRYPTYPRTRVFAMDRFGNWDPVMQQLAQTLSQERTALNARP
jgi:Tfp pilus assembly protein PilF